jgi:hypothetical protein
MKVLIAILSCIPHALNGCNQAMRDTWVSKRTDIEYRFFLGDGTVPNEDTGLLEKSWQEESTAYTKSKFTDNKAEDYKAHDDEVILSTSDKYEHMALKLKSTLLWFLSKDFDFIFVCLTDTYVDVDRLLDSGFENTDYCGTANGERTAVGGGPGIWLSKRSVSFLTKAPVTSWAYDKWVGQVLLDNKVKLTHDERYSNLDLGDDPPLPENNTITSHIANRDRTIYHPDMMLKLHQRRLGVQA